MRNRRLDVLRCIAILLVLLTHAGYKTRVTAAGWVGVDLFFVLSGFLISGLLFSEYQKRGSIHFKRFLIRRGLKLYPAFYVLLLATFVFQRMTHHLESKGQYLSEIFYVQNYGTRIWGQTWSLAVEEHFYILLPLFFLILLRYSRDRANPFRVVPAAFLVVAIMCLALRIVAVAKGPVTSLQSVEFVRAYMETHCRMDSLFFGVLLGYLHHFRPEALEKIVSPPTNLVLSMILSGALLSTCLFIPLTSRLMLTAGLTALYVGFGLLLILSLRVHGMLPAVAGTILKPIGIAFAYVGMYSYSIYLWHEAVQSWGLGFLHHYLHIDLGLLAGSIFYIGASIAFGIVMSKLIEYPVLKLRDRIFPGPGTESLKTVAVGKI